MPTDVAAKLVADAEIGLATAKACMERTRQPGRRLIHRPLPRRGHRGGSHAWMTDFQCTNMTVKRAAVEVVDRAMNVVGESS